MEREVKVTPQMVEMAKAWNEIQQKATGGNVIYPTLQEGFTADVFDPWTGKPVDKLSDLLPSLAGFQCDECGAEVINRCLRCGAPVCCPRCCYEANEVA